MRDNCKSPPNAVTDTMRNNRNSDKGSAKTAAFIDGASDEFEFGGSFGTALLMTGFPLLMWYMWIGATYYDGSLPMPEANQSWVEFGHHLIQLVYEGAYPTYKAWAIYWIFFIMEAVMYCYMPGVSGYGRPLKHEGNKRLPYYCSAYSSFYATLAIAAMLHFTNFFPLDILIDEFGPIMTVAILSGILNSFIVYGQAIIRGRTHRLTGYPIYDFFMGAELNPRIGILDFKMFYEVRIPWFILFLITCAVATRQLKIYGYISPEVLFLVAAHFLYTNACAKAEEMIITSWDMYFEKLGFLLTFWNMAGVPFTYCHCALYFAHHDPSEYCWNPFALATLSSAYLFMYWMWDSANGQKNSFRHKEKGQLIKRNTFPQVPWQTLENPRTISTDTGDHILVDGWFAIIRKPNYVPDMFFSMAWGLITGFKSPFPWFYFVFFMVMILHRTRRDIIRCRRKYGEAWKRYEKEVPYTFIPYVI
ncbi:Delta(24)-sterol reductase (Ergosterol biosynthesis ERG4/ERG24 family protein) [Trichophyton interdigitale]|uniref:Delta(24(24(1)))-sterol reductase n=1 Tax=Trichophyton interdigitale TaxID=101480 RepID=A0A9P4YHH3_9EURO|nr:Delta(24)-sterol reductase (Ergosterol biosynthesis ERG4/ERG24 family protein) [Trichophyton interdigitale]KAF3897802.1 Delta(24)-sterol reductase (Ergosterol biosynthesis ERG4/ERG24 family protein) [Trichophyton interdigitale]KAG8209176.1 Delta(24)-sterol reductase (Ergosterol biosynthesis ERG4/ERG24 family protein) [Trichophyton interdigitale]